MEITNKKECPKCHNKRVVETQSGIGSDKEDGSYTFHPLSEVFYKCEDCRELFSYKAPKNT